MTKNIEQHTETLRKLVNQALRSDGHESAAFWDRAQTYAQQHGLTLQPAAEETWPWFTPEAQAEAAQRQVEREAAKKQRQKESRQRSAEKRKREATDPAYRAEREAERTKQRLEREWRKREANWHGAPWVTLAEASEYTGWPVSSIRSAIRRGALTGQKRGRDWLVNLDSLHWYAKYNRGKRGRASEWYGHRTKGGVDS